MTAIPRRCSEFNSTRTVSSLPAGPSIKNFWGKYEFNNAIEEGDEVYFQLLFSFFVVKSKRTLID